MLQTRFSIYVLIKYNGITYDRDHKILFFNVRIERVKFIVLLSNTKPVIITPNSENAQAMDEPIEPNVGVKIKLTLQLMKL